MQFIQKRKKKYCKSKVNMKHHPNGRLKNIIVFSTLAKYLCGTQDGAVAKVPASHRCGAGANSGDDTMSEMSLFLILSLTLSGFLWLLQFFSVLKNQEWYTKNHYVYVDMLPLNHYLYSLLLSKVLLYAF